jgi:signal transduction histidine kinase/CheY-like chemotaxis protein
MNLSALYPVSKPEQPQPRVTRYSTDLRQAILRKLILLTFGACIALYVIAQFTADWTIVVGVTLALGATGLLVLLSLKLLSSRPAIAAAVWICGSIVIAACGMLIFRQPLVGVVYTLIPLIATVLFGLPMGLLAEVVIAALLIGIARGAPGLSLAEPLMIAIVAGGAAGVLVGWGIANELTLMARWAGSAIEEARREIEDARNQKVELSQTQQDLIHANRELARLSDQLKALNQVAEDARRVKEEFVANVSHELRTPLNMIIGFSDLITQMPQTYRSTGGRLPPELLADIAAIQRNSQHLAKLVDDVLDLSQTDSGRMTLTKEWCDLRDIVDEAMLAVGALYESKGLYLRTECLADAPRVFCDSTRIRQVLLNLLSNAGRFTERGGVRVQVRHETSSGNVVVSVADTGPGIAAEDQARIFEPFQQLDASIRRRHGGSGLGLAISKRFVEMHAGKLWLESKLGEGTTFYFSLPTDSPLPRTMPAGAASARRWINPHQQYEQRTRSFQAPVPDVLPRFVLLETDNAMSQLVSRYVGDTEVVAVRDVEAALYELGRSPAQALIVNSAATDDPALTSLREQLATAPKGVPLIHCWLPGKSATEKRLGVVRYLLKPIVREALLSTIAEVGSVNTILLVDDDAEVLQLFTRMLTSTGRATERAYRVLQAPDGIRALALLRERKPDLVLLDLVMPGMDGWQFLREKQQDASISDIPVIAISAQDPVGEPIAGETLTVTRKGGFAAQDLLACVRAVSEALSPAARLRSRTQAQPESSVA